VKTLHQFSFIARRCLAILGLSLLAQGTVYASTKPDASAEKSKAVGLLVVEAKAAFQRGRIPELERLSRRTQDHQLSVWPDYWRLRLLLSAPDLSPKALEAHVFEFVKKYPQHFLAANAQRDWVTALVDRELWNETQAALLKISPALDGPQMRCARAKPQSSLLLVSMRDTGLAQIRHLPKGQETAAACIELVSRLAQNAQVSEDYLLERLRWAAQAGSEASRRRLHTVLEDYLGQHRRSDQARRLLQTEQTLGQMLSRSRSNSLAAFQSFQARRQELSPEQREYGSFALGAALWRRSHPQAWPLMREGWASLGRQPDDVLEIAARESLRRGEWARLLEVVDAMSPDQQQNVTWRYWQAVGLKEFQQPARARALLEELRHDYGFYGVLARERLGEKIMIPAATPVRLSDEDRAAISKDHGIQRSYALLRAGLRAEAVAEWSAAMRQRTDTELLLAALHAQESGFIDRMIAAADRTQNQHDFRLRFPAAFQDTVLAAAQEKSLSPWWVLGLIRQESRFIPDIRSSAGATGLMQIMPATGKMLAQNIGMRQPERIRLTDISLNVRLGTTYMKQLHDRFEGSALLASAAYNAGPSRAVSWRSALPDRIEGAAFAESIPFNETRDYVKRVLTNAVLYHAVHTGEPAPSLRNLLGEVVPSASF